MKRAFTHLGLFEGIGGFSLAARWMGWQTVAWCEWNQFGQKVLKYHFPEAIGHGDITKTDFTPYATKIDILTGGFPCQPYSTAGKRLGKEDERHLWPEMLRAIREVSPRYVVGENVRGLTNWNGGVVFDEVQADLEAEGYEVLPFLLPACGVGAPHRRDRIWFVAHASSNGFRQLGFAETGREKEEVKGTKQRERWDEILRQRHGCDTGRAVEKGDAPSASNEGLQGSPLNRGTQRGRSGRNEQPAGLLRPTWQDLPTQSPLCSRNDGFPSGLDADAFFKSLGIEYPRKPAIAFGKWRNESLKAAGNAIVPQVAYEIFKAIEQYENLS